MLKRKLLNAALMLSLIAFAAACGTAKDDGKTKAVDGGKAPVKAEVKEDKTPPKFKGAGTAQPRSRSSIKIKWDAASDDTTAAKDIVYHIYVGEGKPPTEADFAKHTPYITNPGATEFDMGALKPGVKYFFAIRARDMKGNLDKNVTVISGETGEPAPTKPATPATPQK